MKNLEIIEAVLTMSKEFRVSEIDKNLYSSIKKTTENIILNNPDCKMTELIQSLRDSTIIGAEKLLKEKDFDSTVNMLIDMAKKMADENEDPMNDSDINILFLFIKTGLVKGMLGNSYRTSKKAIQEIWNSTHGTE